ncbi:helix-turn-helix domain-containing protein [Clostridiaceae bacterium OttesenSCG-928-D20]|nr:helix-turn-helix domain-containing protein [Clostridiaceae bacterium OttesenSCG-928-D20]
MAIYRIKKQINYTTVDNAFINDSKLSYKAKGILLYLLSKPNDWEVHEVDIVKHGSDGKRAVASGIQELIEAGYIKRTQKRNEKNQFAGYEYDVHEIPPKCGFAETGNAETENVTLLSTELTKDLYNQGLKNDNGSPPGDHYSGDSKQFLEWYVVESKQFLDWYVKECYPHYKKAAHPRLKKAQRERVLENLEIFMSANDVDIEGLCDMANGYFKKVKNCDHNINHFATEGILSNRYFEEVY